MTRAFRLRNASGDMIDLLADLDIFGVNPEGLGVSFDHTSHLSNSNYLLEKSELNQNEFKLSVALGYVSHDPYNSYYKLVQFLDKSPYILEYETTAGTWQREVRLKELSKTEIVSGDIMLEDFTLSCFSPWYRNIESKYDPTEDTPGDGKIYIEYQSTALLDKIYAFAYSADGTDGFSTIYPQPNMIQEIEPYNQPNRFRFNTNEVGPSSVNYGENTITLTGVGTDRWRQVILYANGYGTTVPTPSLKDILPGNKYTLSMTIFPESQLTSTDIVNMVLSYINPDGTKTYLSSKNIYGSTTTAGQPYYYQSTTVEVPQSILETKDLTLSITFQGNGTVRLSNIKIEPGTEATGWKGFPTYIGERQVPRDHQENSNIVKRSDIKVFAGNMQIDFSNWMGDGSFKASRTSYPNSGFYLYNKANLVANKPYNLRFKLQAPETGIQNMLLYNPYPDLAGYQLKIDGEIVTTGFGTTVNDIYWFVDKNNPELVDTQEHIIELSFTLGPTVNPPTYTSIILQPDKSLIRPSTLNMSELTLYDGLDYPGFYTQEELPEFYQWSRISGEWAPPTPDGRGYNLTYDNVVYDYDYMQTPATRGPGMHAYKYDYIYEGWSNGANGVFRIENNSIYMGTQEGSPVEIYIDGPSTNPYWEVVRNGVILASDGFNLKIGEGYRLVVSSVPGEQRAELIAPDGTKSNVYQQQRLDLTNFVKIPTGYSQVIFHNAKYVSFNMREEKVVV